MLRHRLSSNFVAEQHATTPLTYLGSYSLVRLIFAAVERNFPLSLNPSIAVPLVLCDSRAIYRLDYNIFHHLHNVLELLF